MSGRDLMGGNGKCTLTPSFFVLAPRPQITPQTSSGACRWERDPHHHDAPCRLRMNSTKKPELPDFLSHTQFSLPGSGCTTTVEGNTPLPPGCRMESNGCTAFLAFLQILTWVVQSSPDAPLCTTTRQAVLRLQSITTETGSLTWDSRSPLTFFPSRLSPGNTIQCAHVGIEVPEVWKSSRGAAMLPCVREDGKTRRDGKLM